MKRVRTSRKEDEEKDYAKKRETSKYISLLKYLGVWINEKGNLKTS